MQRFAAQKKSSLLLKGNLEVLLLNPLFDH